MDEVLKRRVIGAAVLIAIGILIPVMVVKLAQPSSPPSGESVRVYEITPSGQTRAVQSDAKSSTSKPGEKSSNVALNDAQTSESGPDDRQKQPSANVSKTSVAIEKKRADEPAAKTPQAKPEPAPKPTPAPKRESKPEPAPKPAPKPEPKSEPKPKPAPKPAPEPEPQPAPKIQPEAKPQASKRNAPAERFAVQVGSFGDESNAISLTQELRREFPVYYREGELNGKVLYRVRVGPFDTRESADIVASRLREKGLKTQTLSLP